MNVLTNFCLKVADLDIEGIVVEHLELVKKAAEGIMITID